MSSFRGPKGKVARSLGVAVSQKTQKALDRRNFAPGQHGQTRKKSASVYKQQLVEKQRLRFTYNISEAQLAKAYKEANRREGSAGETLWSIAWVLPVRFSLPVSTLHTVTSL